MVFTAILIAAADMAQPVQGAIAGANSSRPPNQFVRGAGRAFLSPMGEPFFGRSAGEDGLVAWFQEADTNHDGALTADEMAADADRFFKTLDLNHDGEIDPDEIAHYEDIIAPEVRTGRIQIADTQATADQPEVGNRGGYGGGHGHGGRHHAGGGGGDFNRDDEASAGRYGLLEIPEPVASADSDLNRGVSTQEFHNAAIQRFELLDINHTGKLMLPELEDIREAAASAARRPPAKEGDEDDSGGEPPQI
jgi:Ca2+-binding EF-hand superfamily protein